MVETGSKKLALPISSLLIRGILAVRAPAVSPLRFCRSLPAFRFVGPMSLAIS
jgi:hypothetical protein